MYVTHEIKNVCFLQIVSGQKAIYLAHNVESVMMFSSDMTLGNFCG